jgi:hypothetical protein
MIYPVIATTAITIATIFLKKALEKSGEKFGEAMSTKVGQAINRIRQHSPEVAIALEAGDEQVLTLSPEVLATIPAEPIFAELLAVADAEPNAKFQEELPEVKAGKILQVMARDIEGASLKAKSMTQTAPTDSDNVEQIMLQNVKVTGDIDLGDLSQG